MEMVSAVREGRHRVVESLMTAQEGHDVGTRTSLATIAGTLGQADCLRVILKKGITLDGTLSADAAVAGHLSCLRVAHEFGDTWTYDVIAAVALSPPTPEVSTGRLECLDFLLKNGCPVDDGILVAVIRGGHVDSVKLLVARGLPAQPLIYFNSLLGARLLSPNQRLCLQHILDNGHPIHPMTLIYAAIQGDLDTVRLLDSKGVELWKHACVEEDLNLHNLYQNPAWAQIQREKKVIPIPDTGERAKHMSNALLYGWYRGAPVTPAMEAVFKAKRAAARATLLCFHVATRLSNDEGTSEEQRATWSAMGRVSTDITKKILIGADYVIEETFRVSLPKSCRATLLDTDLPIMAWMNVDEWWTMIVNWVLHVLWNLVLKWLPL